MHTDPGKKGLVALEHVGVTATQIKLEEIVWDEHGQWAEAGLAGPDRLWEGSLSLNQNGKNCRVLSRGLVGSYWRLCRDNCPLLGGKQNKGPECHLVQGELSGN